MSVHIAPQMLTVPGVVYGQLEIIQNQSILVMVQLRVNVAASVADSVVQSEDYVNWLQWMEDQLSQRLIDAKNSGEFTGPQGENGSTPKRGVDYWTNEDQAAIVQAVLANLTNVVPACTTADNGKFLRVVSGVAAWQKVQNAEEVSV